jgi:prolipoprotein diacylglyceryltransferase
MIYTAGRFAVELMRSDYANLILGLRVNTWVAGLVFLGGAVAFALILRRHRRAVGPSPQDEGGGTSTPPQTVQPSDDVMDPRDRH